MPILEGTTKSASMHIVGVDCDGLKNVARECPRDDEQSTMDGCSYASTPRSRPRTPTFFLKFTVLHDAQSWPRGVKKNVFLYRWFIMDTGSDEYVNLRKNSARKNATKLPQTHSNKTENYNEHKQRIEPRTSPKCKRCKNKLIRHLERKCRERYLNIKHGRK